MISPESDINPDLMLVDDLLWAAARSQRLLATALVGCLTYFACLDMPVEVMGRDMPPVVLAVLVLLGLTLASHLVNLAGAPLRRVECLSVIFMAAALPILLTSLLAFASPVMMMLLWSGHTLFTATLRLSNSRLRAQDFDAGTDADRAAGGVYSDIADIMGTKMALLGAMGLALISMGEVTAWILLVTLGHGALHVFSLYTAINLEDRSDP